MLRAGFASVDITPGPECGLLGYEFRYTDLPPGSAGIHDPLSARVLVVGAADQPPVALVSLDLCVLRTDLARHLRRAIGRKIKTDGARVLLACSHTHSGPFPELPGRRAGPRRRAGARDAVSRAIGRANAAYGRLLEQRLLDAAARAAALRFPVRLAVQEAPLGIGYNRRVPTPDGVRHCWGPQEHPQYPPGPAPDPTCTVAVLRQENGPRSYVLWSAAAHGVVLGKTSRVVSADWPGAACRLIDQWLPGAHSLFFSAAAGDVHPWIATQEDPAQIEPVARAGAAFVTLLAQAGRPADGAGRAADAVALATRTARFGPTAMDLSVGRIGRLWLVAAPVEMFGALAADLRRRLEGPVLLATVANGWEGYWPTRAAFAEGGYEVEGAIACGRKPGDGERLIDALVELAGTLR